MKKISTLILSLFFSALLYSTEQIPDYLVINNDTVPIFNNPLEQYFEQTGQRDLPEFVNPCWSTACWRGYKAFWEMKNDSLFLLKITSCQDNCTGAKDANLELMFGSEIVFAYWYSGTLIVPHGNFFTGYHMGYSAIYEYEERIEITDGNIKGRLLKSNKDLIESIKLNRQLSERISSLSDTLLYYLMNSMNWEKLDNSRNYWCDDEYLLFYDQQGNLMDIKLITYHIDSTSLSDIRFDKRMDKRCTRRMENKLNDLSLKYIDPHKPFIIKIELWYDSVLEMDECRCYYDLSEKEIEDWIKKQLDIKE